MSTFATACAKSLQKKKVYKEETGQLFYDKVNEPKLSRQSLTHWLMPLRAPTPHLKLDFSESTIFTIGRDTNCSYIFNEKMFENEEALHYNKTSRIHFSINLENGNLTLKNNSMNGTFVNGDIVDKKTIYIGDIISVLKNDFEMFKIV